MKKIVRTVCQACHCECGVLVTVEDGRIVEINGDPQHPMNRGFICIKGKAEPERLYHTKCPEHDCFESNINVVMSADPPREEICGSVPTRGTLCRIYK